MNTKFTPEYVLAMLQEIKKLSDQDNFYVYPFFKKHPSFYGFKKILVNKGIISKDVKKPKWLSIIPNIIMAKEISRIFLENRKIYIEEKNYRKFENPNQINNKIKVTKTNTKPISILQDNINPVFFKQTELTNNEFIAFAKKIRKDGEKWNDAVSRASKIIKGIDTEIPVKKRKGNHKMKATTDLATYIRKDGEKWTDAIKRASAINNTKVINKSKPVTINQFRKLTIEELYPLAYKQDFEKLKKENERLNKELEFEKLVNFDNNNKIYDKLNKKIEELKFQLNIETTANGCFKQRIRELEQIPSFARNFKSIHEKEIQNLTNKIETSNEELENFKEKYNDLEQRNKKYIAEYSEFINEKIAVIEDLKNQLHQQQSEKNQISVIKFLGIPLIKKTTKTIK